MSDDNIAVDPEDLAAEQEMIADGTIVDVSSAEFVCPQCGKEAKNGTGLSAHIRIVHEGATLAPNGPPAAHPAPSGALGQPVLIPDWRQATRVRSGERSITMLDPRCRTCQGEDNAAPDWFKTCPHDPYVTIVPMKEQRPVMKDEVDAQGNATGRKQVTGMEEFVSYRPRPNTREIGLSMGSNSGMGVEFGRRKGFILPSELRSPTYPTGIAEACQYRDCKRQTGLKSYAVGTFCRIEEAQLVWYTETGTTLEVGEWNQSARANRTKMLKDAQV